MLDAEELALLLAGTTLGGLAVETHDSGQLLIRIAPEQVWSAWQVARSVVDASGRWPVAIASWGGYNELGDDLIDPEDATSDLVGSLGLDPWSTLRPSWRDIPFDEDWVDDLVHGHGISEAEARDLVTRGAALDDADRLRLDRRLAEVGGDVWQVEASPYLTDRERLWFTPTGQPTAIAFLAAADPAAAIAQLHFYAWAGPELVAVARAWHERYGAELVAGWLTMLQFTVDRPPTTLEDAWELAGQLLRWGGSLQVGRDELAVALMRTDAWFVHDRP